MVGPLTGKYINNVEQMQAKYPALAARLSTFAELYDRKLWHQLTQQIEEALQQPEFRRGSVLIELYEGFIEGFSWKLNLLRLAHIAVTTAQQYPEPGDAVTFLEDVIQSIKDSKQAKTAEPLLYLHMQVAQYKLQMGYVNEAKEMVASGKETLDSLHNVDPSVSAAVHYVSSLYYKQAADFAEYYKASMMYLAFISSDDLAADIKLSLAVDICLAALLGDSIYNFGELLIHPMIGVLRDSTFEWLLELLEVFNRGDMHGYDQLCVKFSDVLHSQPALVSNERRLREKITILCLMELIFKLPAEQRTVSLETIAKATKLNTDGVELLLMKTLSLHLIEGIIDEVEGAVQVSWVQPRVLTLPQLSELKGRLDGWISKVSSASVALEEESLTVLD